MELLVAANQYGLLGMQDLVEEHLISGLSRDLQAAPLVSHRTALTMLHLGCAVHAPRVLFKAMVHVLIHFDAIKVRERERERECVCVCVCVCV